MAEGDDGRGDRAAGLGDPRLARPHHLVLVKHPAWGFLGAAFFLLLAPSSSIVPIDDAAFDHRMYLPLAVLVALTVIGAYCLWERMFGAPTISSAEWSAPLLLLVGVIAGLALTTVSRNSIYGSEPDLWRDVLEKNPDNARAYASLGYFDEQQQDHEHAIENFKLALKLRSDFAKVHFQLGSIYQRRGERDLALAEFREATKADPRLIDARLKLASELSLRNELDEAIEQWREALKLNPNSASAHSSLGDALASRGKLDEAIEHCQKAVELEPKNAGAHSNLGRCFSLQGKLEPAIAEFRRAVELDPEFVGAYFNLGQVLVAQKKFDAATNAYRRALQIPPTTWRFGWPSAWC